MDIGGYRDNNKDFYENITFLKSINRGENDHNIGSHESLVEILCSLLFLS